MADRINSTQEYHLASNEKQRWADDEEKKHAYTTPEDAAKAVGEKLGGEKVRVTCNDGETREVEIVVNHFQVKPDPKYKRVSERLDPGSAVRTVCFMIKGGNPKGKTSIWFSEAEFNKSPDEKALKDKITSITKKFREQLHGRLKGELVKSHSKVGKAAQAELKKVAEDEGANGVFEWFKFHKFSMGHLTAADLKPFVEHLIKTGKLAVSWDVRGSTKPDGFGHMKGEMVSIDWHKKTISTAGWSSD